MSLLAYFMQRIADDANLRIVFCEHATWAMNNPAQTAGLWSIH